LEPFSHPSSGQARFSAVFFVAEPTFLTVARFDCCTGAAFFAANATFFAAVAFLALYSAHRFLVASAIRFLPAALIWRFLGGAAFVGTLADCCAGRGPVSAQASMGRIVRSR
jgi:hypothetical protein